MKIIVSSDWHLDWSTGGVSRTPDINEAVQTVVQAAKREGADLFVFTGDLTNPDSVRSHQAVAIAVAVATHLWFGCGIATRWVVGNHDIIEDGSGGSTLGAVAAIGDTLANAPGARNGMRVYAGPTVEVVNNRTILALPFTPRSHPYDPVSFVESVPRETVVDVVVAHLNIEGIAPGSETKDMPRGRDVFLPLATIRRRWPAAKVINGHYHRRQLFDGVHIPGSLARLTFGEEHHSPGYLVVEV